MSIEETGGISATVIEPLGSPLCGRVRVPGDKSISHRAVIFSAMAEGISQLSGVLDSDDVRSSLDAVAALGADVNLENQSDGSLGGSIGGWGAAGPTVPDAPLNCGNSGTTVRLLMGVLAPWDMTVVLTGDDSLRRRPMKRITMPLSMMGATFTSDDSTGEADTLPLTEHGTHDLYAITYDSPVASAQLKTAVLLAGTASFGTTTVREPALSRNHTELMLPVYGVPVTIGANEASVSGPVVLKAAACSVPGDPSSAAFITCAALLEDGSNVTIENVSLNDTRIGFVEVLRRMGADISAICCSGIHEDPYGELHVVYTGGLHATEVSAYEIPTLVDEVPVLALVAAHAEGTTVFHDVGELRVKESDRLSAIVEGLELLGVHATTQRDDLIIEGNPNVKVPDGIVFDALGDHRLAMTWALVGLCGTVPVGVKGFDAVTVSYPNFLMDMQRLGA